MRDHTRRNRTQLFEDAVAVIDAHLDEQLSLDDVAGRIFTSRRQLQRVFEEVGAVSFREFCVERRMRRARELLIAGVSPGVVATRLGYSSGSHLTRAFRRQTGWTPTDFQRRYGGGADEEPDPVERPLVYA